MNFTAKTHLKLIHPGLLMVLLITCSGLSVAQDLRARLKTVAAAQSEAELQKIETSNPRSEEAALARLFRGYLRLQAKDYTAALTILDEGLIGRQSKLGDYAIYYRGQALQGVGRTEEAEKMYVKAAEEYPTSMMARTAVLQAAGSATLRGAYQSTIDYINSLGSNADGTALKLKAEALEKIGKREEAATIWKKMYFEMPQAPEAGEVSNKLVALGAAPASTVATAPMLRARADKLYQANLWVIAGQAYEQLSRQFPAATNPEVYLRGGVSFYKAKMYPNSMAMLMNVRSRSTQDQADAIYYRGLCYRAQRQEAPLLQAIADLRRVSPGSIQLGNLLYEIGKMNEESQPSVAATYYEQLFKEAPRAENADEAHFWRAWRSHEAKDYPTAARLFIEHVAEYGEVTENRGKAAFWGAMDSERAGDKPRAVTMYKALLTRYGAGWYGYNAERHIGELVRQGAKETPADSDIVLSRAVAKLQINSPIVESINPADEERVMKADSLALINLPQLALGELENARSRAANSPKLNIRIAQIYRARNENVSAVNVLKRAYPDYGQMLVSEMPRAAWDVFYPLGWWSNIKEEAKRKNVDPYMIAGLIRQETIFNPTARSRANAMGLMQLLPSTGRSVAKKYSLGGGVISSADLYNPVLNIQLGTSYVADLMGSFGRFEYVAAAYNGGPTRVARWLRELPPAEIEDWVDSIPLSETRMYVQGVYRNARQYRRLYDDQGRFKPEVGNGN